MCSIYCFVNSIINKSKNILIIEIINDLSFNSSHTLKLLNVELNSKTTIIQHIELPGFLFLLSRILHI